MVKVDSKQKNVRLRFDAWFAIEELQERWGCSRDAALERVIMEAHGGSGVGVAVNPVVRTSPVAGFDPASVPGVVVGPPKVPTAVKRYRCDHCGTSPAVSRVGDICEGCRTSGHRNEVRECPKCGDYGTGAL